MSPIASSPVLRTRAAARPLPLGLLCALLTVGAVCLGGPGVRQAGAQVLVPVAGEQQVNTYTTGTPTVPEVAMADDGSTLVAWLSPGSGGGIEAVLGQLYDADGNQVGAELTLSDVGGNLERVDVAREAGGDFVVVWSEIGSPSRVWARQFASDGTPADDSFVVASTTGGSFTGPDVAVDDGGAFVVTWDSFETVSGGLAIVTRVRGQRFDSSGTAAGGELAISDAADYGSYGRLAMDGSGDFVVAWQSFGSPGDDTDTAILGRRYASDGSEQGGIFQVNTYTPGTQGTPDVARQDDGSFVVAWRSPDDPGPDDGPSIQGRLYDSAGAPVGAQFEINSYTTGDQAQPRIAALADGGFLVAWRSAGSEGGWTAADASGTAVRAAHLDDAGAVLDEIQVNSVTTGDQGAPSLGGSASGRVAAAWESQTAAGDDPDASIESQRFVLGGALGDFVWLDADGDGVQDGGEQGIENVPVRLFHMGSEIDVDVTGSGGAYRFDVSEADDYQVGVDCAASEISPLDQGGDDALDSDVDPSTGRTALFAVSLAATDDRRDIGLLDGTDADGVATCFDNCPDEANPAQTDSDGDGSGDPCDLCTGDDGTGDTDADLVCDDLDVCPLGDDAVDVDGDLVPAACDCDDDDALAQEDDNCGVCGGDDSTCSIFADGFESSDFDAWTTAVGVS